MAEMLRIDQSDKMLIIAPHPDDEAIGCGGILAKYPSQCEVVVLTDGAAADENVAKNEMADIRKNEFHSAMKKLGISDYRYCEYPDGQLMQHPECLSGIDFSLFTKIFIPWGEDNHPDHTAACFYALDEARRQNICAEIYQYEVHIPFSNPDVLLDITEVIDKKIELISYYESQLRLLCYDSKALALAKYRACALNKPYGAVEAFIKTELDAEPDKDKNVLSRERTLAKNKLFVSALSFWIRDMIDGKGVSDRVRAKGWENVSIFGFSTLGQLLYLELLKSGIEIVDILDNRSIKNPIDDRLIRNPKDGNRKADVVIVSAIFDFDTAKSELESLGYANIISMQDVIGKI